MKRKKKIRRNILILTIIITATIFFYLPENKQDNVKLEPKKHQKEEKIKNYKLNLIMVGDALIHGTVYKAAYVKENQYDFKPMLTYIKPIVESYDLAFYNQESIIGGKDLGLSTYPRFNSPDEIGDDMIDTGFNIVSLANNHTLDKGEKGILNSINYWKNKKVMTAGSYNSFDDRDKINIMTKNNITYSLLSYTTLTNGLTAPIGKEYLVNVYNEEKVKQDIESIRDKVDVLMVSMHWGTEYTHTPTEEQEKIANYLSSLGVDIIIGHHPHVIQPIKYINNTLVVYSLGNFISAQIGINKLTGLMVMVDINKTIDKNNTKISINNINAELIYTYRNAKYKVIPYSELDNTILPDYKKHFDTYSSIVKKYDNTIKIKEID